MLFVVSGAATHWRWFLVKKAKAFAPISWAFSGAFSTPPAALTWAPTYFIYTAVYYLSIKGFS